ncbi:MAG TPA: InlB B-repeat-containing protein [Clostridiales bacterium]|nr:InlB B-repeat-containing protein [Clostridiales bacterium]
MTYLKKYHRLTVIFMIIAVSLLLSSCVISDNVADPGAWGYECKVIYNALGGSVNSREIRETYYMKNSYVFKPAGTTNMLIEPVKDGYILAGWYTAKEDIKDAQGNVIGYSFKAEDRWDFDEDRVQEDMTLYARWIPQAKVEYIDAETGEVKFSKNITSGSPIQPLSGAAERLIAKSGYTFHGYYADKEGTIPYNFSEYVHRELIPSNAEIYAQLHQEFPQYIKKINYVAPSDDEEVDPEIDTSDLFINKLGYEITTDDPAVREMIRKRKDEIYEEAIQYYINNSSDKVVYLKYEKGSYVKVSSPEDLKQGSRYSFSGVDKSGNPVEGYVIANDIDFSKIVLEPSESFSGEIIGNGYTLKNITIRVNSKKIDNDKKKDIGLFKVLDGARIKDLTFENINIAINVNSGIPVTAGALAAESRNTELNNVKFVNLTIETGRGDDGAAKYIIGDLFGVDRGSKLTNVSGINITVNASEFAQLNLILEQ